MKQEKELSAKERYVIRAIKMDKICKWRDNARTRTAAEVRRLIKSRKDSSKYERVVSAYRNLFEAMKENDYDAVCNARWEFHHAIKYQGYLQLEVFLAEERVKGLSDDKVEALMLGESL